MSDRPTGRAPPVLKAVLGPTNTGKTHLAVERMLGHASGMIGLPLRLLAREIYDRVVKLRGARAVALITGEEKIIPPRPHYWVCTVEAMPLSVEVEFLAVDEIQLCADPERGHVFTQRLLHARGTAETMLMGAGTMAPLIRRLLPTAEIITRERFSQLSYDGSKKLTRLPRRSAIVAFSADSVYAIAELIRRQRGGAAVVMGSLSPRTRNAQVALYQSGEVDFLVATDAIGMGLNMDVDHVAFAGLRKFDGKRTRWLHAAEIGQIAGRAGRFRTNGTFGVTGEAPEIDEDLVEAVENHRFEPIVSAEWRNAKLDFSSLPNLQRSLSRPPLQEGLKLSAEALDEQSLRHLAQDEDIRARARSKDNLLRLWDACQTPDFRKVSLDEHLRLSRTLFEHLTQGARRVPEDWIAGQFGALDRIDGDIDALSGRLAHARTLAYVANRPDWLRDPAHWQGRMRELEDRLSDTLHEKLMLRFIDRRTSAILRGLQIRNDVLAGIDDDGAVTVEGHYVGRLQGVSFEGVRGDTVLEDRALRAAAQRAVGPEIGRRLGQLAADTDEAFSLQPDGAILWRGALAGHLIGGSPFAPKVRTPGELGSDLARDRAARRLEAFVAAEAGRRLFALERIDKALTSGELKGLARGVAFQVGEAGGVLDRRAVEADLRGLSQAERRTLRSLGIKIGAFSVYAPSLLAERARSFYLPFTDPRWRPRPDVLSALPQPRPTAVDLSAHGLRAVGDLAAPVEALEALDERLRDSPRRNGGAVLPDTAAQALGWSGEELARVLRALGYAPADKAPDGAEIAWKPRRTAAGRSGAPAAILARPGSPFAALAALQPASEPAGRRRPKRAAEPAPPAPAASAPAVGEPAGQPPRRRRRRPRARKPALPQASAS